MLGARHIFGRAPTCDTPIKDGSVSAEHAVAWWADGTWWLKDLGSRNGTHLESTLTRAERVPLQGKQLRFGSSTWTIVDVLPPTPRARFQDAVVEATCPTLLGLPSAQDPIATVVAHMDTWWLEDDNGRRIAQNGEQVHIDNQVWELELPPLAVGPAGTTLTLSGLSIYGTRLILTVSQDQEHVDLEIHAGGASQVHAHHAHHDLVRALAVQRLTDTAAGVPPAEQGWMTRDALKRELRINRRTLAVHVFRTRKMFAAASIDDAGDAIESRTGSGSIRLGITDIEMV